MVFSDDIIGRGNLPHVPMSFRQLRGRLFTLDDARQIRGKAIFVRNRRQQTKRNRRGQIRLFLARLSPFEHQKQFRPRAMDQICQGHRRRWLVRLEFT